MSDGALALRLEAVGYAVAGRCLLDGVSAGFGTGRRSLVLGPNGAGKSLLLRLCHGLIRPSAGRVEAPVDRRQAMLFQRPVLLRRSALGNLTHALALQGMRWRERRAAARAALERFGLGTLAQRNARVLSGGEQQRLALARAWAIRPHLLFLDEPTSALDPAATRAVEEAVGAFQAAGVTVVMTTHDLGQARRLADEVLFLHRGRLLEQTPAADFFRQPRTPEAAAFLRGELIW